MSIEAEYIEKGTFQAGEEDASAAGISPGDKVVILTKKEYDQLLSFEWMYRDLNS